MDDNSKSSRPRSSPRRDRNKRTRRTGPNALTHEERLARFKQSNSETIKETKSVKKHVRKRIRKVKKQVKRVQAQTDRDIDSSSHWLGELPLDDTGSQVRPTSSIRQLFDRVTEKGGKAQSGQPGEQAIAGEKAIAGVKASTVLDGSVGGKASAHRRYHLRSEKGLDFSALDGDVSELEGF